MSETTTPEQARISRLIEATTAAQHRASRPDTSAWVSANAGAGKTHVLKMRVLRLLLAGTDPTRILCLTYTKAAAAEMAQRVFAELADWAVMSDDALWKALHDMTGRKPDAQDLIAARQLFARAIETPGGLKVQTIHAFAERLLQRFPLEAGLPPGFEIIDEETADRLRASAMFATLAQATSEPDGPLGDALRIVIAYGAEDQFDALLREALSNRDWLEATDALLAEVDAAARGELLRLFLAQRLDVRPDRTRDVIEAEIAALLADDDLRAVIGPLRESKGVRDTQLSEQLTCALKAGDVATRAAAFIEAFLTQKMEPRSERQFVSKAVRDAYPVLADTLDQARDRTAVLVAERCRLQLFEATHALVVLTRDIHARFARAKLAAGALDFDDLIRHTVALLGEREEAQWVLYKLDGGIDHILVDEAQDTAPPQWKIITALAAEFFDGEGTDAPGPRSVFAVGDEKQSIYSFQGAAPEMFARAGQTFADSAQRAGSRLETVPLTVSFRTTSPVLQAVDTVFADPALTPGVTTGQAQVRHEASRQGEAGLVRMWPLEQPEEAGEVDPFDPLSAANERSAAFALANRIADTIRHWLETGRRLASQDRPVRAGDILILVRKRAPLAGPIIAALKRQNIAVAGSDRMLLPGELVVQDLMALADFLTLPEDDLALATVLKSPLFGYDDNDLMRLAPERKGSLWSALIASATTADRDRGACDQLKRWRADADYLPPFEFFSALLSSPAVARPELSYRQAILRRLGPDASDPLDEFLQVALNYDDSAPPSVQGFVGWLRDSGYQIKRETDTARDEVRLMTVHGAKGLEAPVVILPDAHTSPSQGRNGALLALMDDDGTTASGGATARPDPATTVWTIPAAKSVEAVDAAKSWRARAALEESNRLLYVAMTRAKDELHFCGIAPKNPKRSLPRDCWYAIADTALAGILEPAVDECGAQVRELRSEQTTPHKPWRDQDHGGAAPADLPEWALRRAPQDLRLQIPIAPSRIGPPEVDLIGDPNDDNDKTSAHTSASSGGLPADPAPSSPLKQASDRRFLRGTLTHALLQHLPQLPGPRRKQAAERFLGARGRDLDERQRASIVQETLDVLADPLFAPAFGADSRAEVAITAEIPPPSGRGPALRISGQIDRLVVRPDSILILDYKTNRPPPVRLVDIAPSYIMQLAAYRLAVLHMFPDRTVRAGLIWTDGARLMEIPADMLDAGEAHLWKAGEHSLDAV